MQPYAPAGVQSAPTSPLLAVSDRSGCRGLPPQHNRAGQGLSASGGALLLPHTNLLACHVLGRCHLRQDMSRLSRRLARSRSDEKAPKPALAPAWGDSHTF